MKTFLLAATVAAGVLCTTSTADAQFRRRSAPVYIAPSYSSYTPYSYAVPSYYDSGVVTSSYVTPSYYDSSIVTSGYTPVVSSSSYYTPVVSSGYYSPSYVGSSYYAPTYGSYYGTGYNNYYGTSLGSGFYVSPSGINYRGFGFRR